MSAASPALPVVSCPGLHLDSLGHYLAALGLLDVAARVWPTVRGTWRNDAFCLIGGPVDPLRLADAILRRVLEHGFRAYERAWMPSQARDTKAGSASNIAIWRSTCSEEECSLIDAHIIPTSRLVFNPVLGTGGNSGRRDFAAGWAEATNTIRAGGPEVESDISHFLNGEPCLVRAHYNGGSWFSQQISPWAMALACEGLPILAGKVSRRLGANTRRVATVPASVSPTRQIRE